MLDLAQNCTQREAVLVDGNNQKIPLTTKPPYHMMCTQSLSEDGNDIVNCSGHREFRSARERWWYVAASKCDQKIVVNKLRACDTDTDTCTNH
jgi:hypothetical protein